MDPESAPPQGDESHGDPEQVKQVENEASVDDKKSEHGDSTGGNDQVDELEEKESRIENGEKVGNLEDVDGDTVEARNGIEDLDGEQGEENLNEGLEKHTNETSSQRGLENQGVEDLEETIEPVNPAIDGDVSPIESPASPPTKSPQKSNGSEEEDVGLGDKTVLNLPVGEDENGLESPEVIVEQPSNVVPIASSSQQDTHEENGPNIFSDEELFQEGKEDEETKNINMQEDSLDLPNNIPDDSLNIDAPSTKDQFFALSDEEAEDEEGFAEMNEPELFINDHDDEPLGGAYEEEEEDEGEEVETDGPNVDINEGAVDSGKPVVESVEQDYDGPDVEQERKLSKLEKKASSAANSASGRRSSKDSKEISERNVSKTAADVSSSENISGGGSLDRQETVDRKASLGSKRGSNASASSNEKVSVRRSSKVSKESNVSLGSKPGSDGGASTKRRPSNMGSSISSERRPSNLSIGSNGEPKRRPSIVSNTEIVTSPGGTKTLSVGLKRQNSGTSSGKNSRRSSKSQKPPPPENDFIAVKPEDIDQGHGQTLDTSDLIDWRGGQEETFEEEEARIAEKLAAEMQLELEQEESGEEDDSAFYNNILAGPDTRRPSVPVAAQPSAPAEPMDTAGSKVLREIVAEKDKQIEALQGQLMQALRGEAGVLESADPESGIDQRDSKILALAKKNRSLTLALERERVNVTNLKEDLAKTTQEVKTLQKRQRIEQAKHLGNEEFEAPPPPVTIDNNQAIELEELRSKLSENKLKLEASQMETKKLKRILAKEVGEDVPIESLLQDETEGWRGRSQKIMVLRDKLKRASSQIQEYKNKLEELGTQDMEVNSNVSRIRKPRSFSNNVDVKAENDIRNIEQERRHAMEKIAEEYEQIESQLNEARRVTSAVKARSKVLENENKRYKSQVKILLSKTNNDDALVDALRSEVGRLKIESSRSREKVKSLESGTTSLLAFEELKQHASSQSVQIERQGQLLVKMRAEMERVKSETSRDIVRRAHDDLDTQTSTVNNKLLRVENERLGELVDLFKRKLERAVLDRESAVSKAGILERQKIEMERRLGNIKVGGRKRQPMADQFNELKDKLALQIEETRSVRAASSQALSQKDEEIRILREMGAEVKTAYERAIDEMKKQVQETAMQAQKRIARSETKIDDALLSQLTDDNEFLRDELQDMRQRSNLGNALSPIHSKSMGSFDSPQRKNRKIRPVY